MTNDAEYVVNDTKLKDMTEMSINEKLFDFRVGSGMGRMES